MSIPLVDLSRQYKTISSEVSSAVNKVVEKGDFILGGEVEIFEELFASYVGVKYCIGVASGTDALLLSLRALDVGIGDEVITTPNTFIATVLPVLGLGAKLVLVDIDPNTYQMDLNKLEAAITKKTKVIIPVHLFGIPNQMDKLLSIAKRRQIKIVEDACHAHGSSFKNKLCGSFGTAEAFSFYPGKNLGAAGDGGAVVTNDQAIAAKIKALRNIVQVEKYKHDLYGYNSRLDTIHAAVLKVKLKYLEKWNEIRRELASLYSDLLKDLPLVLPPRLDENYLQNYHLYV